jgi:hypothetical protein
MADISELVGKTFIKVESDNYDFVHFVSDLEGQSYKLHHLQDCCEDVAIESIVGDLSDLVDTPILVAEARSNFGEKEYGDVEEWTFYTFRTIKGSVDIRWYGTSNGYYSTSASLSREGEYGYTY